MCRAMLFNGLQHLSRVEAGQHHVGAAHGEYGEGNRPRSMGERCGAEAHGSAVFRVPVAHGQFRHRSPSQVGDAHSTRRTGCSARGNQAHQLLEIAVCIAPFRSSDFALTLYKCRQRIVVIGRAVDANEVAHAGNPSADVINLFLKVAVIEQP